MTVFKERQNKTYKSITQGKKKPTFGGLVGRPSLQDPFSVQNAVVLQGRSSNFVLPQKTVAIGQMTEKLRRNSDMVRAQQRYH